MAQRLFMAVVAVASGSCSPTPGPRTAVTPVDYSEIAVTLADPRLPQLGDPCPCGRADHCLALPAAGYCARDCGDCSDGTCVELTRLGRQCMARCTTNRDCRVDDGYLCDPQWRACMIPNSAAIIAPMCGPLPGFGRDPLYAPARELGSGRGPTTVVLDSGDPVVAFATDRGVVAVRVDRLDQLTTTTIADGPANHVALARSGTQLIAAWGGERGVVIARSPDNGASWSTPMAASAPEDLAPGHPTLLWRDKQVYLGYASSGLRVRVSRDGGATFAPPVTALPATHGELAVAADGTIFAIAIRGGVEGAYGSGNQRIELATSSDGGRSYTLPQPISMAGEPLPFFFANPQIAFDDRRRILYVVYVRGHRDGRWDLVVAATKDRGKTWTRSRIGDDPACAIHAVPSVVVDELSGLVHIVWYDSHGPRLAHATCDAGGARCRQLGRINGDPFAALSLLPGQSLVDHDALVLDPVRRVAHVVWMAQTGAGLPPRIFHARGRLPLR